MSTRDGRIWARVPDAIIAPWQFFDHNYSGIIGSEIRPIAITDAATTPVVAARIAPTKITAYVRPPPIGPKSFAILSSKSSVKPHRSNISLAE